MNSFSRQWDGRHESGLPPLGGLCAARDVRGILDYYAGESGSSLADRFFADLLRTVAKALENPQHFPPADEVMRRANLAEFPYHFLYQVRPRGIKVTVARHHRRSPRYGERRH